LSGQRSSTSSAEDGSAELASERDGGYNVARIARNHHADGNLTIVRTVGRVKGATAGIEAHFAANVTGEGSR
jgi:hypothetical protein